LVGACLWAVGLALTGAVVIVWALVVSARGAPDWYSPALLPVAIAGYVATLGGLAAVRIASVRWKMLGMATAAVVTAALLTAAAG
jgi:hypothetical protein